MENIAQTLKEGLPSSMEDKRINPDVVSICKAMIIKLRHSRTMPQPDEKTLHEMAITWAKLLPDVPVKELGSWFDRAMMEYTDTSRPFGVPDLLSGRDIIERERRQSTVRTSPPICRHKWKQVAREEKDPETICGWKICIEEGCEAAYPILNLSGKQKNYLLLAGVNTP